MEKSLPVLPGCPHNRGLLLSPSNHQFHWAVLAAYPLYRRDEKGKPNHDECPLLACMGLLALSVPQMGAVEAEEPESAYPSGRSAVTGY